MYYLYEYIRGIIFFGDWMSKTTAKNDAAYSDEQLTDRIKSGEYESFAVLLGRYAGYIKNMAQKYGDCEKEDLISEGFLELFKAAMAYSRDKGAKFKTFAAICVKDAMLRHYNKAAAAKRIPGSMISSIDGLDVVDTNSPESLLIKKESIKTFFDTAKSELSDFEVQYSQKVGKS